MRLSDLILAASPNQVSLWQSHMAAWNVIDPTEYDKDPELKNHTAIVPFGISNEDPATTNNPFLTNFVGIQKDDPILLWGGGVYDWFDPLTLIEAVNKVKTSIPNIRFVMSRNTNCCIKQIIMSLVVINPLIIEENILI